MNVTASYPAAVVAGTAHPDQARSFVDYVGGTEGQDVSVYLGVEKAGMVVQLQSWFGDRGHPDPRARRLQLADLCR